MIKVMVTKMVSVKVKTLKRILLRKAGTTYHFYIISQYGCDTDIILEIQNIVSQYFAIIHLQIRCICKYMCQNQTKTFLKWTYLML